MVIKKYPLANRIRMPRGAQFLDVGRVGRQPHLWALVDPTASVIEYTFRVYPDGPIDPADYIRYVGSFHLKGRAWHVFET